MEVRKDAGIEKLKINDEIHRSILMEEQEENIIVPLQEALILNDASVRRELMMKIMYDDTSQYVDTLKTARMNEDTEVVHYATTAMVEVQKEYDLKLQQMEKRMEQTPDEPDIVDCYLELIDNYIATGLLEGNMLQAQRRRYEELLTKKTEGFADTSLLWYGKKAENEMELREYRKAGDTITTILEKWPLQEKGYLLQIRLCIAQKDREGIRRTLSQMEDRTVYLSSVGRKTVAFWQEKG
nr:hypothetical protein [uncultured Eisenbergiella sp.]